MRYYPDDILNEIICDDFFNVFKRIPDGSIDITITSPPYNIGLEYDTYEDNISSDEYVRFTHKWMRCVFDLTKETGRLYCVLDDRLIWKVKPIAEEIGWTYVQLLTWCKPNFSGRSKSGGRRINGDWNFMNEYVLLFRKGKRNMMLTSEITTTHSWFKETTPQTNFKKDYLEKVHPAQMPVNLVRKWIARTPGDVVLDPFCGAGSVCIAARDIGRDYIGIDISEEYCRLARERLFE